MNSQQLAKKYIASARHALRDLKVSEVCVNVDADGIKEVVRSADAYFEDAKYYMEKRNFEVSLTSVAYCEGLLDALRLLGMVKFEWTITRR